MRETPQPIRLSTPGKFITVAIMVSLTILLIKAMGHVLLPFIAAIITAYLFNPLVAWLHRRTNISRVLWISVLYLLIFSLFFLVGTWVIPRVTHQYNEIVAQLPDLVDMVNQRLAGHPAIDLGNGLTFDLTHLEEQVIGMLSDLGRTLSGGVPHLVISALEIAIYLLIYLIVTFYLLLQSHELHTWAVSLVPPAYREEICGLGHQIDQVLGAYIRGQLLLVVIMSVLLYIPLSILRVPYALVIAIASGVLELIPILGPWSAATIAMSVALFQQDVPFGMSNLALAGLIGVIYFALRQIEDSFIIPNVVGHLVKLHPGVVLFAVLAGGAIAGPFGLLVSIPTAAVVRILLSYLYPKLIDAPAHPDQSAPSSAVSPSASPSPSKQNASPPAGEPEPRPRSDAHTAPLKRECET